MSTACCKFQPCRDDIFAVALVATGTVEPTPDRFGVVPVACNLPSADDALLHGLNLTLPLQSFEFA